MKDLKISKELISDVLNIPLDSIYDIYTDGTSLLIRKINNRIEEHNIYEFSFKCKELAFKKGFNIFSSCKSFSIFQNGVLICSSSGEKNEIESIIESCEWILEQIKCN